MSASFGKHNILTTVSLLLILALFVTAWFLPSTGIMLGMIFLLLGLGTSVYMTVKKHREAYLQGKISFSVMIRNSSLEITAVLLAMILAALLGKHLAGIATQQLGNDLAKLIAGIVIGLSVGMITGLLIKRASSYLVKT